MGFNYYTDDHSQHALYLQKNFSFFGTLHTSFRHSFAYEAACRNIDLMSKVKSQLSTLGGLSIKSSLTHTWRNDTRDSPAIPTKGNLAEIVRILIIM